MKMCLIPSLLNTKFELTGSQYLVSLYAMLPSPWVVPFCFVMSQLFVHVWSSPPDTCCQVFHLLHFLSHTGLVGDQFVWFRMCGDIAQLWCTCQSCQATKIHHHHHSPVSVIPVPDNPFSHIHMDFVSPLPPISLAVLVCSLSMTGTTDGWK